MIYTVILNSTKNSGTGATPLNRGTRYYNIDWSFLPQRKKYKVSFTFKSTRLSLSTASANILVLLHVDFTGSPNTYEAVATGGRRVSNFLGVLTIEMASTTTDQRLVARLEDNVPIYLCDRPSNNNFLVQMYDVDGTEYPTPSTAELEYVLTLLFEEMD